MATLVIRRLLLACITLTLASMLIFLILRILPGDIALFLTAGGSGGRVASEEDLAAVRHALGMDKSLLAQYGDWVVDIFQGTMGRSFFRETPISQMIIEKGWLTAQITILGMIFAWIMGLPLGVISALNRNSVIDYAARILSITGLSVPGFWIAVLVTTWLASSFHWSTPLEYYPPWENPLVNFQQVVGPSLLLAIPLMAFVARMIRSSLLEVMGEDFVRTARSKGLIEHRVITRHVLKIALLPAITLSGIQVGLILGATVVIERVWGVDGLSNLLLNAVLERDLIVVQNVLLVFVFAFILINLITDIIYSWLDPRIRVS